MSQVTKTIQQERAFMMMCISGTYAPPNKHLWDVWFIKQGNVWHMFHLQSDSSVLPKERHHLAEIGHATSTNLLDWKQQPVALIPGKEGSWDDLALWTGSVIEHDGTFYQFYTGRSKAKYWEQYIGLATSTDLKTWQKYAKNPILERTPDYCPVTADAACNFGGVPAWRDPSVIYDEVEQKFVMVLTSRTPDATHKYNGAVAVATSNNLTDWQVEAPLLAPGIYEEMETPQLIVHKEHYYVFFSSFEFAYHPEQAKKHGGYSGLHCYTSDALRGKYVPANLHGQVLKDDVVIYAPKIVEHYKDDLFIAIGWLDGGHLEGRGDKDFLGRLSAPFLLELKPESVSFKKFFDTSTKT